MSGRAVAVTGDALIRGVGAFAGPHGTASGPPPGGPGVASAPGRRRGSRLAVVVVVLQASAHPEAALRGHRHEAGVEEAVDVRAEQEAVVHSKLAAVTAARG